MIDLSTIDLKSLPWLPLDEKTAFTKQSAIYFAIDSLSNVQYIGRSQNVHGRWASHHRYDQLSTMGGVKIAYLFVDLPELLPEIEAALIEYFNPPLNTVKPNLATKKFKPRSIALTSKGNDKMLAIYVSQEMFEQLEELAATEDRSISNFTRNLIAATLEQRTKK